MVTADTNDTDIIRAGVVVLALTIHEAIQARIGILHTVVLVQAG